MRIMGLHTSGNCLLTTTDYEEIQKDLAKRRFTDKWTKGDRVLDHILHENKVRYEELKLMEAGEAALKLNEKGE